MRTPTWNPILLFAVLSAATLVLAGCGGEGDQRVEAIADGTAPLDEGFTQVPISRSYTATVDTEVDGPQRSLDENPFEFAWDLPLPAAVHTSWTSPQTPELLYVQLVTGEIHGIDIYSGITHWVTRPLPKPIRLPPYVHRTERRDRTTGDVTWDHRLYVISGDVLFTFDCEYGQLIWRHQLGEGQAFGFQPSSGPFALGAPGTRRVYVGDWEGRIQVVAFHQDKQRPYVAWQWNLRATPSAQPNGQEGVAYVGDQAGMMSCFGLDRELLWQFDARAPIRGSSLVRGRSLYFGSDDDILHVLNRLSGEVQGELFLGASIRRRPIAYHADPQSVYVFTEGRDETTGLRAIHTSDDNIPLQDVQADYQKELQVSRLGERWFLQGIDEIVGSSPGRLYVTRSDSTVVLAVDRHTGGVDWHWDVQEARDNPIVHITPYVDPADKVRAIVTVDEAGKVVAYRLFGAETRE